MLPDLPDLVLKLVIASVVDTRNALRATCHALRNFVDSLPDRRLRLEQFAGTSDEYETAKPVLPVNAALSKHVTEVHAHEPK